MIKFRSFYNVLKLTNKIKNTKYRIVGTVPKSNRNRKNGHPQEELEDTKGVIRISKSKDRQHNGLKKKHKGTNNVLQNIHIQLKIE